MFWDVFALQRRYNGMQYGPAIDGVKQDQVDAFAGTFSLYGVIREAESTIPVEAILKQRFLAGSHYVRINGVTARMERVRHAD
ncbi:MAG: hypothetical protein ACOCYG_03055, partial [Spirochaetota bacterium]